MLTTNANFDALHDLASRVPMYLVHFDGETVDYCNHQPASPSNTLKQYLVSITGAEQRVTPEEGKASVGGIKVEILDYNDEITALLATDPYFFHRRKTTIRAGYFGMAEADMLTVCTGWVTGIDLSKDGLNYIFDVTDPKRWMQRKVFRSAKDTPVTVQGNPINILLAVLTSTGAGTNGDYDWYAAENGLGLTDEAINVSDLETQRDDWYPGDSQYRREVIEEPIVALEWIEALCKELNAYPVIDGRGRFSIKPFKPPLAATDLVQSFNQDNIIDPVPQWNANFDALINEVELYYDWDDTDDEFTSEAVYAETTSLNNRGPGREPLTIKSKGLHTTHPGSIAGRAADILATRKNRVFGRWATPPVKLRFKTLFSRWLSEAGDVVPFTHPLVPDLAAGTRGYTNERMEVINRNVDWKKGEVGFELLATGFARGTYAVISPCMTITAVSDRENFTVSEADALKYAYLTSPEVQICDAKMRQKVANVTVLAVDAATGAIEIDDAGVDLQAGWIVCFANYDDCTAEQKRYGFVADSSSQLGTANDAAHLIVP